MIILTLVFTCQTYLLDKDCKNKLFLFPWFVLCMKSLEVLSRNRYAVSCAVGSHVNQIFSFLAQLSRGVFFFKEPIESQGSGGM